MVVLGLNKTGYIVVLFILYCWECNSIQIIEGPSDARRTIGSTVLFRCIVSNMNDEPIRWVKNGTSGYQFISHSEGLLTTLSDEKKERFSIIYTKNSQFDLQISRVLYSDGGTYECVVMHYDEQAQMWNPQSFRPPALAQLTILKEPSRASPICSLIDEDGNFITNSVYYGDDYAKIQCMSQSHGSTSPILTLFISGKVVPNSDLSIVDKTDLKTITTKVSNLRQGMAIECVLESEALIETKLCRLTPKVEPVVRIQPGNITLDMGSEINLECLASGFSSDNLEYLWTVYPEVAGIHSLVNSSFLYIKSSNVLQNCSSYLIVCKVTHLNTSHIDSTVLQIKRPVETSTIAQTETTKNYLPVLSLIFIVIIIILIFFIWRRHKRRKLSRFTGLRYTIEPSTNSNTNVPIHSESRSSNIYSTGTEPEKTVSRSSSVKENLYARYRKFRKSQEFSVHSNKTSTTADDQVNDTVRAIIENHRLSDIDPRSSVIDEEISDSKEEISPGNEEFDEKLQSGNFEDHSNNETTAHIYENVIIKGDD